MTAQAFLILSLSKDAGRMVRHARHEDVSLPPTLTLPRKGGGDSFFTLPLEGVGKGGGDRSAAEGAAP